MKTKHTCHLIHYQECYKMVSRVMYLLYYKNVFLVPYLKHMRFLLSLFLNWNETTLTYVLLIPDSQRLYSVFFAGNRNANRSLLCQEVGALVIFWFMTNLASFFYFVCVLCTWFVPISCYIYIELWNTLNSNFIDHGPT